MPHSLFSLTCLLQYQILLLNVFELLGLGFLLQASLLTATLFYLSALCFHDFDLVQRDFKLLVERMDVQEILIRRQFLLALLEAFLDHLLLLTKTLYLLESLVLDSKELFLALLDLLLQTLFLLAQL